MGRRAIGWRQSRQYESNRHDRGNFNDSGVAPYVGCHLRTNRKTLYRQSQLPSGRRVLFDHFVAH